MCDVMEQLESALPLPRGERLATWFESTEGSLQRSPPPVLRSTTWWKMLEESPFPGQVIWAWQGLHGRDAASLVRRWAFPLRRCRVQRQEWMMITLQRDTNDVIELLRSYGGDNV